MRSLLTDPPDEVGGRARVLEATIRQRLGDELNRGDRGAQLMRDVTDKVAPNSLEMVHARFVAHHQHGRHLAVERDRASVEIPVVEGDGALLDTPALAGGVEQPYEPVVDLAGDEVRAFDKRKPEQAASGFIGKQYPALGIEADDAGVEQQSHGSEHVDAPRSGEKVDAAQRLHRREYRRAGAALSEAKR